MYPFNLGKLGDGVDVLDPLPYCIIIYGQGFHSWQIRYWRRMMGGGIADHWIVAMNTCQKQEIKILRLFLTPLE